MKRRAFSRDLDDALIMAARAHRDQLRKGSDVPYLMHPVHVAIVLLKCGFPDEMVLAGVLHDVVEDGGVSLGEIAARFGDEVARLVEGVTEQKTDAGGAERPWRRRKEEQLHHLARASPACAALKAADALHNCQTTLRDIEQLGEGAWRRFRAPPEDQLWYYDHLAALVRERLGAHPLCDELDEAVAALARWQQSTAA